MCFKFDALPPRVPEDRVVPALAGGAGAERLTLESADGTAFATAWGSNLGVMIPNNGLIWLYYVCGATAGGVVQVLVGDLSGNTGQVLPATTETYTIAASTSGWLGPWSPGTYNQQSPTNVTYSGAP